MKRKRETLSLEIARLQPHSDMQLPRNAHFAATTVCSCSCRLVAATASLLFIFGLALAVSSPSWTCPAGPRDGLRSEVCVFLCVCLCGGSLFALLSHRAAQPSWASYLNPVWTYDWMDYRTFAPWYICDSLCSFEPYLMETFEQYR